MNLQNNFYEEAQTLSRQAKYQEAIQLLKQASTLYEKMGVYGKKWGGTGKLYWSYAFLFGQIQRKHLSISACFGFFGKTFLEKEHLNTLNSLNGLGVAYIYYGDYDSALTYLQKVLAILNQWLCKCPCQTSYIV